MSGQIKKGKITFIGDRPVELAEDTEQGAPELNEKQVAIVQQLGATIKAYLNAIEELLQGKYSHIRDWAPVHLSNPGNVLVVGCPDGVVIRFERKTDKKRVIAGWFAEPLTSLAPLLSQNLVHCYPDRNFTSTVSTAGVEIRLSKVGGVTKTEEDIFSARIGFDAVIERPERVPVPPNKPFCLLSVQNHLELQVRGVLMPLDAESADGEHFIARTLVRLPVGWECIEIYPFFDLTQWRSEHASIWAESDLLGAVVSRQFQEAQFQSLDPKAEARRELAALLKSYKDLLDSNQEREEILQSFLRDHPVLLCPTQIKVWPKLALGARETDFVFREAAGDYLLVELERPTHQLFLKDGHQSSKLNHARGQVVDWKRYLEDNLSTVQRELGLTEISASPRSIIVMGRSRSLTPENRRKLVSLENESPKVKIMTYDDVYENAKAVIENLLGTIWDTPAHTQIYYLRDKPL